MKSLILLFAVLCAWTGVAQSDFPKNLIFRTPRFAGTTTTSNDLAVLGNLTVTSNVTASGSSTVGGTLGVTGASAFGGTVATSNGVTVGGPLTVTGAGTFGGIMVVTNTATFQNNIVQSGGSSQFNLVANPLKVGSAVNTGKNGFIQLAGSTGNTTAEIDSFAGVSALYVLSAQGTSSSPAATTTANRNSIYMGGNDGVSTTIFAVQVEYGSVFTGTWSSSDHGMTAVIGATPSGTTTRVANFLDTGNGISISSTTATAPGANSVLELQGNGALRLNQVTKAQRNALTAQNGMVVYQIDNTPGVRFYENGTWVRPTVSADP